MWAGIMTFPFGVELRDVLTIVSMVVALWLFDRRRATRQALRDQRIDMILFGTSQDGERGLVRNVKTLRIDMYDQRQGAVPQIRHHVSSIRTALATHGIETPDH